MAGNRREAGKRGKAVAAATPAVKPALSPTRLTAADLANVLKSAGGRKIDAARIEADLAAGAPKNADGTIHLVHYAAWLVEQRKQK